MKNLPCKQTGRLLSAPNFRPKTFWPLRHVAQDYDAGRQWPAVDQLQPELFARLEQRRPAAENDRVHRDAELVDQSVRDQAAGEIGAAEQKNVLGAVAFQPGDGFGYVSAEHLRVVPTGFL